jgi:hypothetical protein
VALTLEEVAQRAHAHCEDLAAFGPDDLGLSGSEVPVLRFNAKTATRSIAQLRLGYLSTPIALPIAFTTIEEVFANAHMAEAITARRALAPVTDIDLGEAWTGGSVLQLVEGLSDVLGGKVIAWMAGIWTSARSADGGISRSLALIGRREKSEGSGIFAPSVVGSGDLPYWLGEESFRMSDLSAMLQPIEILLKT